MINGKQTLSESDILYARSNPRFCKQKLMDNIDSVLNNKYSRISNNCLLNFHNRYPDHYFLFLKVFAVILTESL